MLTKTKKLSILGELLFNLESHPDSHHRESSH